MTYGMKMILGLGEISENSFIFSTGPSQTVSLDSSWTD